MAKRRPYDNMPVEAYRGSVHATNELFRICRMMWHSERILPELVQGTFIVDAGQATARFTSLAAGSIADAPTIISTKESKAMHIHKTTRTNATTPGPIVEACTSRALPDSNICNSTTTFTQIEEDASKKARNQSESH